MIGLLDRKVINKICDLSSINKKYFQLLRCEVLLLLSDLHYCSQNMIGLSS